MIIGLAGLHYFNINLLNYFSNDSLVSPVNLETLAAAILNIVLPCNICIERANVVDIDVAVWLRHECRVTYWLR